MNIEDRVHWSKQNGSMQAKEKKNRKRKELKYINQIESHQQWRTRRVERALNADAGIKLRTIDFSSSSSRLSSNNMYLFVFQSFHYFYYYLIGCICHKNRISTENWISFSWVIANAMIYILHDQANTTVSIGHNGKYWESGEESWSEFSIDELLAFIVQFIIVSLPFNER